MGNCQAAEAAAVVIQHPGGKVERLYWPTTAADVMRANPGHYVALVILRISADKAASAAAAGDNKTNAGGATGGGGGGAKITRVKLLKPKDTLLLGQVYRLITSQEVTKALRARKNEKMRRCEAIRQQHEQLRRGDPLAGVAEEEEEEESASDDQDGKRDRHRSSGAGAPPAAGGRGRHWRPSLQSISEAASQSGGGGGGSSISESAAR
ncbi:uncharacterized protein [Oryza sativa Japonica Group]|jgi:uncharacterized spore protein YtfJ|uniref:Os09g0381600 protein n=2 Tax=Oryza sativa subsp. japonica TaxID=39947 RepID=Q6H599_ORYSJ|nr:uncharacterized protein LOC4346935 [Oryza sativa Japonica Group]KAB8110337.1 hypothetical protein EE612_047486 [Oryza sativa]EAZ44574.1 hypothetical protein OsJ_29195 [Oryza sativa Japonica Group]KAF2915993.1 hypothetical protein DAI22_09g082900 [Oryza sativa Japonica Group]BAD25830.1 unknown protein [Oryza sativa Japonica Group]BAD26100.1 unknown protein [Oryza sativa Japonica Group]|eukprot:NP_001063061.1 Os09g0381600 [Oryza sativa Japonica Group]